MADLSFGDDSLIGILERVKEVVTEWTTGSLDDWTAMYEVAMIVHPTRPTEADLEWARKSIEKMKAREGENA